MFFCSLYQSEGALATRCGSLKQFFHYPRYPWEQKGSHGSCIVIIPPLVHPFRAKCFALCFTMPVFAEELEYREYYIIFFPLPTVSPGWEVDSLWTPRKRQTGRQHSGAILRDIPLVNCEVDMVVLSSYYSLAT